MKQVIKRMCVGMGIGSSIFLIGGAIFTSGSIQRNIISIIVMGLLMGLVSTVFEVEKLSILLRTSVGLIGNLVIFLGVAKFNNWFPMKAGIIFTAVLIFVGIFFVIWTFYYLHNKKQTKVINEQLLKKQNTKC